MFQGEDREEQGRRECARPRGGTVGAPAPPHHEPGRGQVGYVCDAPEKEHRSRAHSQIPEQGDAQNGGQEQGPQDEVNQ